MLFQGQLFPLILRICMLRAIWMCSLSHSLFCLLPILPSAHLLFLVLLLVLLVLLLLLLLLLLVVVLLLMLMLLMLMLVLQVVLGSEERRACVRVCLTWGGEGGSAS